MPETLKDFAVLAFMIAAVNYACLIYKALELATLVEVVK